MIFLPGRARFCAKPAFIGSPTAIITIGVCTENLIHVDEVAELPKLAQ